MLLEHYRNINMNAHVLQTPDIYGILNKTGPMMLHFVVDIKMCSPLGFSRSIRDTSDVMLEACLQQDKSTPLQSPAGVVADNEAITEHPKKAARINL